MILYQPVLVIFFVAITFVRWQENKQFLSSCRIFFLRIVFHLLDKKLVGANALSTLLLVSKSGRVFNFFLSIILISFIFVGHLFIQ